MAHAMYIVRQRCPPNIEFTMMAIQDDNNIVAPPAVATRIAQDFATVISSYFAGVDVTKVFAYMNKQGRSWMQQGRLSAEELALPAQGNWEYGHCYLLNVLLDSYDGTVQDTRCLQPESVYLALEDMVQLDPIAAIHFLRYVVAGRPIYWLRCGRILANREIIHVHSQRVRRIFRKMVPQTAPVSEDRIAQAVSIASLPGKCGGFGIRDLHVVAPAAYLASVVHSIRSLTTFALLPQIPNPFQKVIEILEQPLDEFALCDVQRLDPASFWEALAGPTSQAAPAADDPVSVSQELHFV
eukprot:scaffold1585_cov248-Pinguiococcus_pyrenoidosus.AAC.1